MILLLDQSPLLRVRTLPDDLGRLREIRDITTEIGDAGINRNRGDRKENEELKLHLRGGGSDDDSWRKIGRIEGGG